MSQAPPLGSLDRTLGYVIKQVDAAMRGAMDEVLRPLDLTVAQFACLELLHQRPELSNAELARAAFVTRQSMNLVLRGLEARGLISRPATATTGRARPAELTETGRALRARASAAVRRVEARMAAGRSDAELAALADGLRACIAALERPTGPAPSAATD